MQQSTNVKCEMRFNANIGFVCLPFMFDTKVVSIFLLTIKGFVVDGQGCAQCLSEGTQLRIPLDSGHHFYDFLLPYDDRKNTSIQEKLANWHQSRIMEN